MFAKEQWEEQNQLVQSLSQQYKEAKSTEDAIQAQLERVAQAQRERGTYVGTYRISFYCPCSICNGPYSTTATGSPLTVGTTIAVDPSVIPLGSRVYIEGIGWRVAQDTGGAIKGNRIDVLVGGHQEAYALGVQYRDVYVQ